MGQSPSQFMEDMQKRSNCSFVYAHEHLNSDRLFHRVSEYMLYILLPMNSHCGGVGASEEAVHEAR
jgi:hypothetical protein